MPLTLHSSRLLPGLLGTVLALFILALGPSPAHAEAERLMIELNKAEEIDEGGCRAFFLFRNRTGKSFAGFEMSLAILDSGGVIDRLLSIDASPLPVQRTTLKLFEIPEISCANISEILLHDVTSCQPQNEGEIDCFPILDLGSRSAIQLVK